MPTRMAIRTGDERPERKHRGLKPLSQSRIERNGLKPGTPAPEFTLTDVHGRRISLLQYRGRRVLLVFSDPHCGPCNDLAPQLVRAARSHENKTSIILVGRGDFEQNRQKADAHGFEFPVVVQDRWKLSRKYGIFATPVAFLIDEEGRTAREVAVGSYQIRALLREEFAPGRVEKFITSINDFTRVLSAPIPRRYAFRLAGCVIAGAVFSAVGMQQTAAAFAAAGAVTCGLVTCGSGETCCDPVAGECCPQGSGCCGGICCESGWRCCGSDCCPGELACCNGKCCAPTEVCLDGKCQQPVLP